ncbi:hypothetical protein [Pseudomonas sp. TWRC1-2]|uniref:hypothetical protein n=1 Tax=Pseudomonas sp. TWRC1-2 TaxID=2804628 RepID=UPI003CF49D62
MPKNTRASRKALKLSKFLQSIIQAPPDYAECKIIAVQLKSQGAMASLTRPELGIEPISLNALKTACTECFDEGFQRLETLRLRALSHLKDQLSSMSSSEKRNKPSLLREIGELKESKQRLEGNLLILTQALRLSIGLCEKYVRLTNKPEYREAFNLERLEVLEMLSYSDKR